MGQPQLSGNLNSADDLPLAKCPTMRKVRGQLENFLLVNKTLKKSGLQGKLREFRKNKLNAEDSVSKLPKISSSPKKSKNSIAKPKVLPPLQKLKLNHQEYLRQNTLLKNVVDQRGFDVHEHAQKCLEVTSSFKHRSWMQNVNQARQLVGIEMRRSLKSVPF